MLRKLSHNVPASVPIDHCGFSDILGGTTLMHTTYIVVLSPLVKYCLYVFEKSWLIAREMVKMLGVVASCYDGSLIRTSYG